MSSSVFVILVSAIALLATAATAQVNPGVTSCSCRTDGTAAEIRSQCASDFFRLLSPTQQDNADIDCQSLGIPGAETTGQCVLSLAGDDVPLDTDAGSLDDGSCGEIVTMNNALNPVDQHIVQGQMWRPYAAPAGCTDTSEGGHVFTCERCFSSQCGALSNGWVFDESAQEPLFMLQRDLQAPFTIRSATMTGILQNQAVPDAKVSVQITFSNYLGADLTGFAAHLGECSRNTVHPTWRFFGAVSGTMTTAMTANNPLPAGLSITVENKVADKPAQFGFHRAHLKGVDTAEFNEQFGGSTWVALGDVTGNPASSEDVCRMQFTTYVSSRKRTIDFNIRLDSGCVLSCDPEGRIGRDPHVVGFLNQRFNVLGEDQAVYALVSTPHVQYNARFAATPFVHKRKHATLISEMGVQVGDARVRVRFTDDDGDALLIEVNGELLSEDSRAMVPLSDAGDEFVMRTSPLSAYIVTREFHFVVDGQLHRQRHLDDGVKITDWRNVQQMHGLLGQTAQPGREQRDLTVEYVVDFNWPHYLDGGLSDYVVADGLFGTEFTYNRFDSSA